MPISKQKVDSFSAIIQDLSEKLRLISSNSKFMQPKCINLEMKNLSNSVQEIAPILSNWEEDNHRNKFSSEFAEVSYEIDQVMQSYSTNRDVHKAALELKAIHTKVEKISKKLRSNINTDPKQDSTMKMTLKNTPIPTLTISGKSEEKESIISLLLQSEPCIVSIIHKYKPNSTKFARDIFEDKRITNHFTRVIWVDAPRLIDIKKLNSLVQKRPSTLFWVIKMLNKDVEEERVLLVLDDIKKKLPLGNLYIRVDSIQTKSKIYVSTGEKGGWYSDEDIIEGSKKMSVEEAWKVINKEGNVNNLEYERTRMRPVLRTRADSSLLIIWYILFIRYLYIFGLIEDEVSLRLFWLSSSIIILTMSMDPFSKIFTEFSCLIKEILNIVDV